MAVNAPYGVGVTSHVDKGRFCFGQGFDGVVCNDFIIATKAFSKCDIARAG